jgi:hypothetical protein
LLKASAEYDDKKLGPKNKAGEKGAAKDDKAGGKDDAAPAAQAGGAPVSFNPVVRLYWPEARALFVQTAYVRIYSNEPVVTFERWHRLNLSIQATAAR